MYYYEQPKFTFANIRRCSSTDSSFVINNERSRIFKIYSKTFMNIQKRIFSANLRVFDFYVSKKKHLLK